MTPKLIHITDLYHPHNDPDDHFDLAQLFALQKAGKKQICRIVIDWPANDFHGDPAFCAVAQLNHIAGTDIPVSVGAELSKFRGKPELFKTAPASEVCAAEKILEILREETGKIYLSIVGGCLDTAIALARDADLFREKCAGIILNAGSSKNTGEPEWNVRLGRLEYAAVFSAPCPVFWNPCFETVGSADGTYKTFWRFRLNEVFCKVSPRLSAYFAYLFTRSSDPQYLRFLGRDVGEELRSEFGSDLRDMWCTASLFDAAGLCVDTEGAVCGKDRCQNPVFSYEPICISCNTDGETDWKTVKISGSPERYILKINDREQYPSAMSKALSDTLSIL